MYNEKENMSFNAYAYMPEHPTPFITRKKELPHKKPSEDYIEMCRFFATHDFDEVENIETGELEFVAVPKKRNIGRCIMHDDLNQIKTTHS